MQSHCWLAIPALSLFLLPSAAAFSTDQEPLPATPAPQEPAKVPSTPSTQTPAGTGDSSSKRKHSHAHDFLIRGTVFTDKALAFPGAKLRIRRAGEKRFRWETYTNSRGEFAVRVPQGAEYEIVIVAKGFQEQTRSVSAKAGLSEDSVTFRLNAATGGKK